MALGLKGLGFGSVLEVEGKSFLRASFAWPRHSRGL